MFVLFSSCKGKPPFLRIAECYLDNWNSRPKWVMDFKNFAAGWYRYILIDILGYILRPVLYRSDEGLLNI